MPPKRSCLMALMAICVTGVVAAIDIENAQAIPAVPSEIELKQPDGSPVQVYLRGDAKRNWYEDRAGYPVVKNEKGEWVYAVADEQGRLQPTACVVGKGNPRDFGVTPHFVAQLPAAVEKTNVIDVREPIVLGELSLVYHRGSQVLQLNGYTVIPRNGGIYYAALDPDGFLSATDVRVDGRSDPSKLGIRKNILPNRPTSAQSRPSPSKGENGPNGDDAGKKEWWILPSDRLRDAPSGGSLPTRENDAFRTGPSEQRLDRKLDDPPADQSSSDSNLKPSLNDVFDRSNEAEIQRAMKSKAKIHPALRSQ